MNGLDYSMGMPDIAAMKQGNVVFVCRYVGWSDLSQAKILTPAEAQTLSQNGITIVSNYEWYGSRPQEGAAAADVDADRALRIHAQCGGPDTAPIYFSVDYDSPGDDVADYFRELGKKIGLQRVGAYGGYRCIKYLFDNGLITWGWQTYAWSGGQWDNRAHIRQTQNSVQFGGIEVDFDTGMFDDIGQWKIGGDAVALKLDANGCVVTVQKSFQLEAGESPDLCGPWSVVAVANAVKPGDTPTKSAEDIDQYTDSMIAKVFPGEDYKSFPGVMPADMLKILNYVRDSLGTIHYWIVGTLDQVVQAVQAGYPCIISCNEADVNAWDKNNNQWVHAYTWNLSAGHVFPVTGIDNQGNLICPDQLNNSFQGYWPPIYQKSGIAKSFSWGCIVKLPFLKPIPDPTNWPANFNAQNFTGGTAPVATDYKRAAFEHMWKAMIPSLSTHTGLADDAWTAYQQGKFRGPVLPQYGYNTTTGEVTTTDWNGKQTIRLYTANGYYEWDGSPHWYSYS